MENNLERFQKNLDLTSLETFQRLIVATKNRIKKNPDRRKEILIDAENRLRNITLTLADNRTIVNNDDKIQNFEDALKKLGLLYYKTEPVTNNKFVQNVQENDILDQTIKNIKQGADSDTEIEKARMELKKLGINNNRVESLLDNIYSNLGMTKKQIEDTEEVLLKDSGDYIPLPKLDVDYDESLAETKFKKKPEQEIIPPVNKPILDPQLRDLYKNDNNDMNNYTTENRLKSNKNIFIETDKLEDFIRESKICILPLPIPISKIDVETELIKYMSAIRDKFLDIIVFGWEYQQNKNYYRRFDEFLQINKEKKGSLFIIRDIKTFNYYAIDAFTKVSENYFIILLEPTFQSSDLANVENLLPSVSYIWPTFADLEIKHRIYEDVSIITGDHLLYYRKELLKYYQKYNPISKEIPSTGPSEEAKIIGKNLLNVFLDNRVLSLSSPGVSANEAINRSPKYRNLIVKILANSNKRILVKCPSGLYGLDALTYIYSKLKKTPIKPVIVNRITSAERKKDLIDRIPNTGPCLIFTDFSLYDVLTPKNIDLFYIVGGGEREDVLTYLDLCKGDNYPRQIYPRIIETTNFLAKLEGELSESYDQEDYKKYKDYLQKIINNNEKLRSLSYKISVKGRDLIVSKDQID